jgi:hypothetical protein
LENPVVYAKNYAELQQWLGKIVEDISLSMQKSYQEVGKETPESQ